ncbi:hypothetical protein ABBQ32_14234 [Trebouxia sp. C0010 RCD-2024]
MQVQAAAALHNVRAALQVLPSALAASGCGYSYSLIKVKEKVVEHVRLQMFQGKEQEGCHSKPAGTVSLLCSTTQQCLSHGGLMLGHVLSVLTGVAAPVARPCPCHSLSGVIAQVHPSTSLCLLPV